MSTSLGMLTGAISSLLDPQDIAQPRYQPPANITWQIQLQGPANTGYDADLYILDLFDTPQSVIDDLHASGRKVICYFSAGSYEEWRQDARQFDPSDKGHGLSGWPGERWLNTRSANVRSIMVDRLDLAKEKGCDGVDPDNVDAYTHQSGFPLNYESQLDYNRFLFNQAQSRGLAVSLKNNLEQVDDLLDYVDFAVNESCHQWQECHLLSPMIDAGKPVLHIDYLYSQDQRGQAIHCDHMASLRFQSMTLPLALDDSFRMSCFD